MTQSIFARDALLSDGWAKDVHLEWNAQGTIIAVRPGAAAAPGLLQAAGPILPGMPNLHSHAFQRAFAGLTEYAAGAQQDNFWSWRALMYRFASRLGPDHLEAIATWLYTEMLLAGYTSVCEFQYLHHDIDGKPYAEPHEMSLALMRAARSAGIGFTLLPVLYQCGGFGAVPAGAGQRRFLHGTEAMLRLLDTLAQACAAQDCVLGLAPHSLRAVPPPALRDAVAGLSALRADAPIHIHIAEQRREVEDCMTWCGQRPVAWLLDHMPVDARWCLVHATHMDEQEHARAAATGAVAGLCPSTEANLGDGLFDYPRWRAHGGRWGIGSDSHVCVNAAEELMLLEYGQRLRLRARNVGASASQAQVATALTLAAVAGGAQASGRRARGLAPGQVADFVVLDASHPALQGLDAPSMLSAHVFASHRSSAIDAVWVSGRQRVVQGGHLLQAPAREGFLAARRYLLDDGAS